MSDSRVRGLTNQPVGVAEEAPGCDTRHSSPALGSSGRTIPGGYPFQRPPDGPPQEAFPPRVNPPDQRPHRDNPRGDSTISIKIEIILYDRREHTLKHNACPQMTTGQRGENADR